MSSELQRFILCSAQKFPSTIRFLHLLAYLLLSTRLFELVSIHLSNESSIRGEHGKPNISVHHLPDASTFLEKFLLLLGQWVRSSDVHDVFLRQWPFCCVVASTAIILISPHHQLSAIPLIATGNEFVSARRPRIGSWDLIVGFCDPNHFANSVHLSSKLARDVEAFMDSILFDRRKMSHTQFGTPSGFVVVKAVDHWIGTVVKNSNTQ